MAIAIAVTHIYTPDALRSLGLRSKGACSTPDLSQWNEQQPASTQLSWWVGLGGGQCFQINEVLLQFKSYEYVNGKEEIAAPLPHPALNYFQNKV